MKVKTVASTASGGSSVAHVETNDSDVGWNVTPITPPANLTAIQKPQVDTYIGPDVGKATFTNKYTGWSGQNGAPQGR